MSKRPCASRCSCWFCTTTASLTTPFMNIARSGIWSGCVFHRRLQSKICLPSLTVARHKLHLTSASSVATTPSSVWRRNRTPKKHWPMRRQSCAISVRGGFLRAGAGWSPPHRSMLHVQARSRTRRRQHCPNKGIIHENQVERGGALVTGGVITICGVSCCASKSSCSAEWDWRPRRVVNHLERGALMEESDAAPCPSSTRRNMISALGPMLAEV
mmetsp:Transcript_142894/g.319574  ORF Transcript_142894/g.319574 Transcript_142894/m.319574 type:complete len:215 (+) Transcript_142894:271-915(+)